MKGAWAAILFFIATGAQAQVCPNIQQIGPYQVLITTCPTAQPTASPSPSPSPTVAPTPVPTASPSPSPVPTIAPTPVPSPTQAPVQTPSPTPLPTQAPTASPTPAPAFSGSTAAMQAAKEPGIYNATTTATYSLDGHNLVNNQLLDDAQAAALVQGMGSLPYNSVETAASVPHTILFSARHFHGVMVNVGTNQTVTGDNYYENANPTGYAAELANWTATQTDFPASVAARVDGAIPISNPTFAQINAWAALKWGINPALGLGEAMEEDSYNINSPGDVNSCADTGHDIWGGCSTGPEQVADRGANHGWSGLLSNNLAAESLAFHMDFFYMHYYAEYNGLFLEWGGVTPGQIVEDIQYWCGPSCTNYSTNVLNAITTQGWVAKYYGGKSFPLAPAVGTSIPNL